MMTIAHVDGVDRVLAPIGRLHRTRSASVAHRTAHYAESSTEDIILGAGMEQPGRCRG